MYKLEIISRGHFYDFTADPERRKVYKIETWTFRMLDADGINDYLFSEPLPASSWDDAFESFDAYAAAADARMQRRQKWDAEVLTLLTGKRVPIGETRGWSIVSLFHDTFAAARSSLVTEEGASA